MPVIPQYQRQVGEAAPATVRQQAFATPDAYGAGIGQAIGTMGKTFDAIADRMDTAAVITAENALRQKTSEYLNGNLLARKGLAAKGIDKELETQYKTYLEESGKGLSGRAKQIFAQRAQQYQTSLYPKVQEHIQRQSEIAANDAYSGGVYADVQEAAMPGAFMDGGKMMTRLAKGDADTAAMFAGRDASFVKAKQAERRNLVLSGALGAIKDRGQTGEAEQFIEMYGKFMDPRTLAPFQGWVDNKKKDNALYFEAEQIAAAAGGDYAKVDQLVKNSKGSVTNPASIIAAAEREIGKRYGHFNEGDIADGITAHDCGTLTQTVFRSNGIDLKSRDVSEQARMLNEGGKYFTDAKGLKPGDLVFYKNTYQPKEGHGFQNITHAAIYAGNGKIIHAGSTKDKNGKDGVRYDNVDIADIAGYGRATTAGATDPAYQEKLASKVYAILNREKSIKANQEHQEMVRVENELALADGDAVRQQEIVNSSSLDPRHTKNLLKQIADAGKLKESDASAYRELLTLKIDGKLTPEKVSEYGPLLTRKDYFTFFGESLEIAKKSQVSKEKEADNVADKVWHTAIDGMGAGKQKYEKDQLAQSISYILDNEKLKGDARRVRALELIKQDAGKGTVFKQVTQDKDKWAFLSQSWGEGSINGLKKGGLPPAVAEQFLMSIDRNDWLQNEALRLLIESGKPINKENLNHVMIRLASPEHPYKPFEMR